MEEDEQQKPRTITFLAAALPHCIDGWENSLLAVAKALRSGDSSGRQGSNKGENSLQASGSNLERKSCYVPLCLKLAQARSSSAALNSHLEEEHKNYSAEMPSRSSSAASHSHPEEEHKNYSEEAHTNYFVHYEPDLAEERKKGFALVGLRMEEHRNWFVYCVLQNYFLQQAQGMEEEEERMKLSDSDYGA